MKKKIYLLFLFIAVVSCSTIPVINDTDVLKSIKNLKPTNNQGLIYILRPYDGTAGALPVYLNGQYLGSTGRRTFLYAFVNPGKHIITTTAENTALLNINVEPNEIKYVRQYITIGWWRPRTGLEEITSDSGILILQKTDLSADCVEYNKTLAK